MTSTETVKTLEMKTPHGTLTLAKVTYAGEFYGKKNYYSHRYNSMGQEITGGFMFVEGSTMAENHGI